MTESIPKRARIGLNFLFLRPGRVGGGETYARGLLQGLQSLNLPHEFVLFLNSEAYPTFDSVDSSPNFRRVLCPVSLPSYLRHIWEQTHLPGLCRSHELDLLHCVANVIPFRARCPVAVTIHDLLYKVDPGALPWSRRHLLGTLTTASARMSDLVITVSHTTGEHLTQYLAVPTGKIHVTPEGPGQPLQECISWDQLKAKYNIPVPYFLTVGTAMHKRLDLVAEAAMMLREKRAFPVSVVAVSPLGQEFPNNDVIRHYGFVLPDELSCLYRNALALICFSDVEGFGLTTLEAMGVGTPVIASDAAALSEVIGDGGIFVPRGDAAELSDALWRIATDENLRNDLRDRGLRRVAKFSWKACASETVRAYETLLSSTAPGALTLGFPRVLQ